MTKKVIVRGLWFVTKSPLDTSVKTKVSVVVMDIIFCFMFYEYFILTGTPKLAQVYVTF